MIKQVKEIRETRRSSCCTSSIICQTLLVKRFGGCCIKNPSESYKLMFSNIFMNFFRRNFVRIGFRLIMKMNSSLLESESIFIPCPEEELPERPSLYNSLLLHSNNASPNNCKNDVQQSPRTPSTVIMTAEEAMRLLNIAATLLQSNVKSYLQRQKYKTILKRHKAAVKIQAVWRGYRIRNLNIKIVNMKMEMMKKTFEKKLNNYVQDFEERLNNLKESQLVMTDILKEVLVQNAYLKKTLEDEIATRKKSIEKVDNGILVKMDEEIKLVHLKQQTECIPNRPSLSNNSVINKSQRDRKSKYFTDIEYIREPVGNEKADKHPIADEQIESSFDRYRSKVTNKNSTMKENLQLSLDPYESTFSTLPDLNYNLIPSMPTSLSEEIVEASERDLNENKEKENNLTLEKTDTEKHENTLSMVNDSLENTLHAALSINGNWSTDQVVIESTSFKDVQKNLTAEFTRVSTKSDMDLSTEFNQVCPSDNHIDSVKQQDHCHVAPANPISNVGKENTVLTANVSSYNIKRENCDPSANISKSSGSNQGLHDTGINLSEESAEVVAGFFDFNGHTEVQSQHNGVAESDKGGAEESQTENKITQINVIEVFSNGTNASELIENLSLKDSIGENCVSNEDEIKESDIELIF